MPKKVSGRRTMAKHWNQTTELHKGLHSRYPARNPQTTTERLQQQHKPPHNTHIPQHLPQQNPPKNKPPHQQNSHPSEPTEYNPPPLQQQQTTANTDTQDPRYRQQGKTPHIKDAIHYTTTNTRPKQQNTTTEPQDRHKQMETNNTPHLLKNPNVLYAKSTRKNTLLPTPPNHMNTPPPQTSPVTTSKEACTTQQLKQAAQEAIQLKPTTSTLQMVSRPQRPSGSRSGLIKNTQRKLEAPPTMLTLRQS
ncbi:RNA-binding protein 33-like [Macrobrachium nipponense]|uniref:RNA-binding protein 33-like n=1 Tax=Macrobrachium nipponense TaxID=159736 RepID=UPI0030C7BE36